MRALVVNRRAGYTYTDQESLSRVITVNTTLRPGLIVTSGVRASCERNPSVRCSNSVCLSTKSIPYRSEESVQSLHCEQETLRAGPSARFARVTPELLLVVYIVWELSPVHHSNSTRLLTWSLTRLTLNTHGLTAMN